MVATNKPNPSLFLFSYETKNNLVHFNHPPINQKIKSLTRNTMSKTTIGYLLLQKGMALQSLE